MKSLIAQAYDPQGFYMVGQQVIEKLTLEFHKAQNLPVHKTLQWEKPEDQLTFWQNTLNSSDQDNALALFENVISKSINLHNRGYFGHQVPPTLPITILTSAIIAFLNNGMAVYEMGMAGNAMEKIVIARLAKRFGFGDDASGVITSGGTLGNLTALLAARNHFWHKRSKASSDKLAIMVSEEAHYSVSRAFTVMGIPLENIIRIPVLDDFTVDVNSLEQLFNDAGTNSKQVFCVIGCACTTATGAYDNLSAIADFAESHGIWFHVDGAHGGAAVFSPTYAHLLNGVEHAHSLILDFHKMMMVPSLSTALIFRSHQFSKFTFTQNAQYLWEDQQSDEWYNSGKQTFECTKPMSILHTYTIMKIYGDRIYQENIDKLYGLARTFAQLLNLKTGFEICCPVQANIVCFRYKQIGKNSDELNKHILHKIMEDGRFYIVSTIIKGEFYLRTALMNPLATINDLKELLQLIEFFGVTTEALSGN